MFTPSVKLLAWTQLRRANDDSLAQSAADVLEEVALDEIKWAWIQGDLSPMSELQSRSEDLPESEAKVIDQTQIDQMLVERDIYRELAMNASGNTRLIAGLPISPVSLAERPRCQPGVAYNILTGETFNMHKPEALAEEVGQAPEMGEIPQAFEGPRKLVNSQALSKALKKYAESHSLAMDTMAKAMGWRRGLANLRSILNKKGSVDTKYADFFVSLFGQGILSD